MGQVFDGLRATVGGVHREMKADLDDQRKVIDKIDEAAGNLNTVRWVFYIILPTSSSHRNATSLFVRGLETYSKMFLKE